MDPIEQAGGLYPEGAPAENVPATAYADSVPVIAQQLLPNEMWEIIYSNLSERQKAVFRQTSRSFNYLAHDNTNIKLRGKFARLFGGNSDLIDQMRLQFTAFLSENGIYPSNKEQLYWFDFILFLNDGQNISCDGVTLERNQNAHNIFRLSKHVNNTIRCVLKERIADNNYTSYCVNGILSRDDGPSRIITERATGNLIQEIYKRNGTYRPASEGPGIVQFSGGTKIQEIYYINNEVASDGSSPSRVTWYENGNMFSRVYRKRDQTFVDKEMVVSEIWSPSGSLITKIENMLFDGRYWLTRTISLREDGSVYKEEYRKLNQHSTYVLHREDGPAVILEDGTGEFWLDDVRQQ